MLQKKVEAEQDHLRSNEIWSDVTAPKKKVMLSIAGNNSVSVFFTFFIIWVYI